MVPESLTAPDKFLGVFSWNDWRCRDEARMAHFSPKAEWVFQFVLCPSPEWPKRKKRGYALPIREPLYVLRAIHTGHVGDYVAFLTFGVAAIGVVQGLWR